MMSFRDKLLKPLPLKEVLIEELGVSVYIKRLSGEERKNYIVSVPKVEKGKEDQADYGGLYNSTLKLVALTLCDEKGERQFGDTPEELAELAKADGAIIQKLYEEAAEYNKLTDKAFKEAVKNSETSQN